MINIQRLFIFYAEDSHFSVFFSATKEKICGTLFPNCGNRAGLRDVEPSDFRGSAQSAERKPGVEVIRGIRLVALCLLPA